MKENKTELITTADGSHTLYVPALNEHYHSVNGAIQESAHVFIEAGYRKIAGNLKHINILEAGFGTGLNALLTLKASGEDGKKVNYIAIEPYPLKIKIIETLNYCAISELTGFDEAFRLMHECNWLTPRYITETFILNKIQEKIENINLMPCMFNLVYFDAFAPDVQPKLWTQDIFSKIFEALSPGGVLVTYSAKGEVKRNLKAAGFNVESLPGPAGKREITRALK